ncbi:MAG: VTT domain-containing protein [Candidatus Aminicenantes bacterium]
MKNSKNSNSSPPSSEKRYSPGVRKLLFALQVSFVLVLLIIWLSSKSIQSSHSLWVLFFYSFPSEFLIAVVPHEPVLLYFGKFYPPLTVAVTAIIGTVLTEALNYSVIGYITDTNLFQKIRQKKTASKIIQLFQKAPFLALWIAGFTPVPFYPFRLLVVLARYPVMKYLVAVFLSRAPRFYILAFLGHAIKFPDYILVALFVILIAFMNFTLVKNLIKKKKILKKNA